MEKRLEANLTEGSVISKLLHFAWPLFIANLLVTMYNIVDTLVLGLYEGSVGISAVTTGGQLLHLLSNVGMGFAGGGQILIAQLKGANDEEGLCKSIGSLITLCAGCGLIVGIIGVFVTPLALQLLNTPEAAWQGAHDYMLVTSIGLVFLFANNALNSVMRGLGDSIRPMLFVAVATIINIILDLIMVGPMGLGAMGAAVATVIAFIASDIFGLVYLYRNRNRFAFDFKLDSFKPRFKWIREHLRLGIPMSLQSSVISITVAYVISLVNVYGVAASSAVGIGGKLINVCCMPYFAVGTAAGAICGQSVGAGKLDRVKETVDKTMCINLCVAAVTTVLIVFIPDPFIHFFDTDPEVVEICRMYLRLHIVHNCCMAIFNAQSAASMGVGNTTLSAIAYIVDGVVLRLALCLLFTRVIPLGLFGIIMATAVAPIGALAIFATYYWSGLWRKAGKRRFESLNACNAEAPVQAE